MSVWTTFSSVTVSLTGLSGGPDADGERRGREDTGSRRVRREEEGGRVI